MNIKPALKTNRMDDGLIYSPEDITKSPNNLFGLDDLCKKYLDKTSIVLELGTNNGVSTSLFAYYAKRVIGIDINFTEKMKNVINNYDNIEFINGNLYKIIKNFSNNYFDLIYIDADHYALNVIAEIALSIPKIKLNGIIAGHDYHEEEKNKNTVYDAVNFVFSNKKIEIFKDSSWAVKL